MPIFKTKRREQNQGDGGYAFYIQNESPREGQGSQLAARARGGGFYMVMRLYLPSKEAQEGIWKAPRPVRAA